MKRAVVLQRFCRLCGANGLRDEMERILIQSPFSREARLGIGSGFLGLNRVECVFGLFSWHCAFRLRRREKARIVFGLLAAFTGADLWLIPF